jgi:hypothetical protein
MTDPLPQEGYTWPVAPAGAPQPDHRRPARRDRVAWAGLTRRQGIAAGTVFAVLAVWSTVFSGVELPWGLGVVAAGVVASALATALPRVRPFAQGFLAASVVAGVGAAAVLIIFFVAIFVTAGP